MADPKNDADAASDLPEELVRRIESLHARLGTMDYFTLLGLPRSATRAQVRQAFLALAPQFHPDKYFGKRLGPYSAKLQRVFAQISVAHDTLANDELRAEYARGLPPPPAPTRAPSSPDAAEVARTTSRPPMSEGAAAAAARQAFASRLAGHSSARMRAGTPAPPFAALGTPGRAFVPPAGARPASSASSPGVPAADPQAAVNALRRRYEDSVAQARGKQTVGNVQAAEAAVARGDFTEAARLYRAATEHSSDPKLRAVLAQAETKAKDQQRAAAVVKGKEAEEKQEYAEAGANWARAFELAPAAETAHRAALCFRRSRASKAGARRTTAKRP